jgi:hypothetical protein
MQLRTRDGRTVDPAEVARRWVERMSPADLAEVRLAGNADDISVEVALAESLSDEDLEEVLTEIERLILRGR